MTRVGSRRVIQYAAVMLLFIGVCSKVGALFVTIPEPIIGKDCQGSQNYLGVSDKSRSEPNTEHFLSHK